MRRRLAAVLLAAVLGACASTAASPDPDEPPAAWPRGVSATLPTSPDPEVARTLAEGNAHFRDGDGLHAERIAAAWTQLASLPRAAFRGTVVYLHGCDGIGPHGTKTADWLADAGYLVLVPDGFARHVKPPSCDPVRMVGGMHRQVLAWRQAEADQALRAALALPAVEPSRLFLMGLSEGAIATATYRGVALAGRVIEAWTCHAGWPEYAGLAAPPDEPVLALTSADDPWFRDPALRGDCGEWLGPPSRWRRSIVFRAPHPAAAQHDLMWNLDARRAVLDFLGAVAAR